jgi:hypothetical protein
MARRRCASVENRCKDTRGCAPRLTFPLKRANLVAATVGRVRRVLGCAVVVLEAIASA